MQSISRDKLDVYISYNTYIYIKSAIFKRSSIILIIDIIRGLQSLINKEAEGEQDELH